MDTRALKLELLEKLASVNDEAKLVEVKHVLDGTDSFELSDAEVSMVSERFEQYKRGEAKTYTWDEVQRMLEENRRKEQR
jgi:hypothetical protein